MSIPVTASTETESLPCMAEIEGAPTFTFRHATVLDKTRFHELRAMARLRQHSSEDLREVVIHELRKMFTSEGMEQNVTRLTAYWAAIDEHDSAMKEYRQQVMELLREAGDGDVPKLPPQPELDFPKAEIIELNAMVDQVERHSEIYASMLSDNIRFESGYPRLLMRMFLADTTLDVELKRDREGVLTPEAGEAVIEALAKAARKIKVDPDVAVREMLFKSVIAFTLTGDEEKNSSSPLSGISSLKQSASTQSSGKTSQSSAPATSGEDSGLNSSASDSPAPE